MNPEPVLLEIANAIKHRCISTTERWYIIYYHDRICCVPSYENVPPEIILDAFTGEQARNGFNVKEWAELSKQINKLYKKLHK